MTPIPPVLRTPAVQLAVVAAAALLAAWWAQSPAEGLYGYDGVFHIKYAEILRDRLLSGEGPPRAFPWWQETFLKDRFADKDFLYHVMLAPFASGDLEKGGKQASIFFAVVLYCSIFVALHWLRAPAAAIWTLAAIASSTTLLYRAGLLRSHVAAIALALLGIAAILWERHAAAAILSALYALTHIAWHLLPAVALLYDLLRSLRDRRIRFGLALSSLAGTSAAVVLSPYFPANLKLWWVQNAGVLSMAWTPGAPDLGLGLEVLPGRPEDLLYYNAGPAIFTLIGVLFLWPRRRDPGAVTLGAVTLGFLAMSLMSRRFVEFWAPISVLFAAVTAAGSRLWERLAPRLAVRAAVLVLFAMLGALNLSETRRIVGDDPGRLFDSCAAWLRDNAPEGAKVFTTDWDEFPELFFVAPGQHYLVGLDPTFMYETDPDRWRVWREVAEGRAANLARPIARTFGCRYVFADAGFTRFIERADQDPLFRLETRSPDCAVYTLGEPGEDSGTLQLVAWRADSGADRFVAGPGDFVDVEKLTGAATGPSAGQDPQCARITGTIRSDAPGPTRLALSTDDRIQVGQGGTVLYDSAAAPPPTIDEVLEARARRRGPGVRTFDARLAAGDNDLEVTTCQTGAVWGFHLEAAPAAGPPDPP